MTDDTYHRAVSTLASAEGRRAAEVADVLAWYERELRAHQAALRGAGAGVDTAAARVEAASALRDRVEAEAQRLWQDMRTFLGRLAAARLGPVPGPDLGVAVGTQPLRHLQSARSLLEDARRPKPLRRSVYILLPLLGALCGAGLAVAVRAAWRLAGGVPHGLAVALAVLGAPVVAILLARWVTRREGARLDGGSLGGTVIGALIAVSVMMVFVR